MARNAIDIQIKGLTDSIKSLKNMEESIDDKFLQGRSRYYLKPMVQSMKSRTKSVRLSQGNIIGVTTAKRKTRGAPLGVRVGVINNDAKKFPDFSAFGLAAVHEYGTAERYRELRRAGFITGRVSTGSMPAAPFLRPSWDAHVEQFMKNVEQATIRKVERAA